MNIRNALMVALALLLLPVMAIEPQPKPRKSALVDLVVATVVLAVAAWAGFIWVAFAADRDYPAQDLLAACGVDVAQLDETSQDAYHIGYCDGFVHAVGGLSLSGSLYCPPKGATADDARAAAVPYLRARPGRLAESRVNMLLEAYQAAWPCEDPTPPIDRWEPAGD